jgi:peroxiredoxin
MRRRFSCCIALLFTVAVAGGAEPATQPSTNSANDVKQLLHRIDAAYAQLTAAEFDGRVTGHADVAGDQQDNNVTFTSTFRAPNYFRHEATGDVLVGSTGDTAYVYQPSRNVYQSTDAPKDRAALSDYPRALVQVLQVQNPSLLLALTKSPSNELEELAGEMTRLPDTTLPDGTACPTLRFELPTHQVVTMLVDPATSLLRQVRFDWSKVLTQRGTTDLNSAEVIVDYTTVKPQLAAADDAQFAWTPPAGATLASAATMADDAGGGGASAMVGKEAPDFKIAGLDDKPVALSSTKGSVVVLDFWATWCGPCVGALPKLDEMYKELSPKGLKMFAVDQQEEKDTVKTFVDQKKLSIPVLLDAQGAAGKPYGTDEGIPITVVIGKDGIVKKVFVGTNDEIEAQIKASVMKELGS